VAACVSVCGVYAAWRAESHSARHAARTPQPDTDAAAILR